jgi:uncharacterized protein
LGYLLISGEKGIMKNPEKGLELIQQAAARGDAGAQNNLGAFYIKGQHVDKDFTKGWELIKQAAQGDSILALATLGQEYYYGNKSIVGKADYQQAFYLFQKAANKGSVLGASWLGVLYRDGKGVGKDLNQAAALFNKSLPELTIAENPVAFAKVGLMLFTGEGYKQDQARGFKLIEEAAIESAKQGGTIAHLWLANQYWLGNYVKPDCNKAIQWALPSAEKDNNSTAQAILSDCYRQQNDNAKAFKWATISANQNNRQGQYMVGDYYLRGTGVAQNKSEAVKWWQKAAAQDEMNALNNLGVVYELGGAGLPQSYPEAARYYQLSADHDCGQAKKNLARLYIENKIERPKDWQTKALSLCTQTQSAGLDEGEECRSLMKTIFKDVEKSLKTSKSKHSESYLSHNHGKPKSMSPSISIGFLGNSHKSKIETIGSPSIGLEKLPDTGLDE